MKKIWTLMLCALFIASTTGIAGAETSVVTVSAIVASVSSISVSPTTVAFGTLAGSGTTYRFKSPGANVTYFGAGPYEIRVYTDNDVGAAAADKRGFLKSSAPAGFKLFPKLWCPNFSGNAFISGTAGPSFPAASAQTQYLWGGYDLNNDGVFNPDTPQVFTSGTFDETTILQDINGDGDILDAALTATATQKISEGPSLAYMRELDTHTEGDTVAAALTRCVLAWNTAGRGDGSLGNPFPVAFVADVNGVKNATYSSANNTNVGVTFELLIY